MTKKHNKTVNYLKMGMMKWTRRVTFPMFHHTHVKQASDILRNLSDELQRISQSNSLRQVDKCVQAQMSIVMANFELQEMTPTDPRVRGCEESTFSEHHGYVDHRGFKDLLENPMFNDTNDTFRNCSNTINSNTPSSNKDSHNETHS